MRSELRWVARLLLVSAFMVGGCKDKLEDLPEPPVDDDWIDQIGSEDGGEVAVAGAPAAAPVEGPVTAEPALAAGETEGAVAPAEAGDAEAPVGEPAPAEAGTVAAAGGGSSSGGSGAAAAAPAAPSGDAAADAVAEAEPGEVAPAEVAPAEVPAAEPAPEPEPAKPAPPPPITMADYTGTWVYSGGSSQKQKLTQAIEDAAQQVPGIIRGIARKRLTKTQILETPVVIKVNGDQITFNWKTTGNSMVATIDGPTSTMKYSGDKYKVKVRSKGSKLITTFMASDATKTIVYHMNSDRQRMTVHHRLVADQLDTPVTFQFSYRRQ